MLRPCRLGRGLQFETTGSLPRAESPGVSSSSRIQRGTNPNRNARQYLDSIPTFISNGKTEVIYGNE
jgi:hypothetical protein